MSFILKLVNATTLTLKIIINQKMGRVRSSFFVEKIYSFSFKMSNFKLINKINGLLKKVPLLEPTSIKDWRNPTICVYCPARLLVVRLIYIIFIYFHLIAYIDCLGDEETMINEIIKLRKDGLSFRKIASELDTTVGKVQYRWNKWIEGQQQQAKATKEEQLSDCNQHPSFIPIKGELTIRLVTSKKIILFWDVSVITDKVIQSYFQVSLRDLVSVIRIYDVTDLIFDGENAHHYYEINVPYQNGHWFVKGLAASRSYVGELGVFLPAAGYFPLFRSNCVHTPKIEWSPNLLNHDQLEILRYEASPPKWTDHVSTYSYYGGESTWGRQNG